MSVPSPHRVRIGALSVLISGPGQDSEMPPVLAVHGFASSAIHTWETTGHLRSQLAAGRRVISPDLRGHGDSAKPLDAADYTLPTLLADLRAVLDTEVAAEVDLLGYSLGARLCAALAAQPGVRVRRMVLGGYDGRPLFQGVDVAHLQHLLDGGTPTGDHRSADTAPTERVAGIVQAVPGNDRKALSALVHGIVGSQEAPRVPTVPTLVVAGAADPLASGARAFAESLPLGEFLSIPGRDHVSAVTARAFRDGAAKFLAHT